MKAMLATPSHSTSNEGDTDDIPRRRPGVHIDPLSLPGGPSFRQQQAVLSALGPEDSLTSPGPGASNKHHSDHTNAKDNNNPHKESSKVKDKDKDKDGLHKESSSAYGSTTKLSVEGGHIATAAQGGQAPPDSARRPSADDRIVPAVEGVEVLYKDISTLLVAVASKGGRFALLCFTYYQTHPIAHTLSYTHTIAHTHYHIHPNTLYHPSLPSKTPPL